MPDRKSQLGRTAAAMLALLCLCAPDPPRAQPPARLNWMGHWLTEDLRETLVRDVALDYSFRHPDLELNLRFHQEILGARSKPLVARYLAEMIRSGVLEWDVVWMDDHIYAMVAEELGDPLWGRQHLVSFETVPGFAQTQKPFILEDASYRAQTGGILVGPYIEGYYYALWVNTAVAQRLGLQVRMRHMSFEDLLGYVERVEQYNLSHPGSELAAFYESKDWCTLEILFQSLVHSELAKLDQIKAEGQTPEKQAALRKALGALETLGRHRPLIASAGENQWFDTRHLVLEDKALFYVNGTWMYSHWHGLDKVKLQKMAPAELPVFHEVDHALGGYVPTWAVMKNSPNREAAIDLQLWWCRPEVAEKWVRSTKNPTGLEGNLSDPSLGEDPYAQFSAYMSQTYGPRVYYASDTGYLFGRKDAELQAELVKQIGRLLRAETSAEQAYQELVPRAAEVR